MKHLTGITVVGITVVALTIAGSWACEGGSCGGPPDMNKAAENIKGSLGSLPLGVEKVNPTPVKGIYEVWTDDGRINYMDDTGQYLFMGQLIDVRSRKNLTAEAEATRPAPKVDVSSLPLENAIKYGNGKRRIFTFEDPDCGYCRKLHPELKNLAKEGVEVYVFLFPLRSKEKSVAVWCSKDRNAALESAINGGDVGSNSCENPMDKNIELGRKLGVRGTPMIILDNGKTIPGYAAAQKIREELGLPKSEGQKP